MLFLVVGSHHQLKSFCHRFRTMEQCQNTLTLKKMKEKGFYKIYGHNEALDEIPEIN